MHEYKPMAGEDIYNTTAHITQLACLRREPVRADFNGVTLVAEVADDYTADEQVAVSDAAWRAAAAPRIEAIVRGYHEEMQRRADAHRASPKGIREAAERDAEVAGLRALVDECMVLLPSVDLGDYRAALAWMVRIAPAGNDVSVTIPSQDIMRAFGAAGYAANEYTGAAFVPGDARIEARYIIGQALACLARDGYIHDLVVVRGRQWMRMFGGAA